MSRSRKKKSDRLNKMLTIIVERPTIEDLFRSVLDLKTLSDEQNQSLHENEKKLKSIEDDFNKQADKLKQSLNDNEQKLKSIEEDFNKQADKLKQSLNDNEQILKSIEEDFNKLADKQKQSLNDNEQKLKRIEEDLISNQQNLSIFRNETKKLVAELSNSQIEWKGQIDKALDNQVLFNSNTKVVLWRTLQQAAHISELQTENTTMKQLQNVSNSTLSALTNLVFIATTQYNGTVYLLSNGGLTDNIRYAQTICEVLRGYLVEVNTDAEFTFLRNFLQTITPPLVFVYTGGTDEDLEGVWINRYSQTSMKPFWAPLEPSSSIKQNCQTFWKKHVWYMDDLECSYKPISESGFMCEISE
ncbi:uncharacterized protein LOC106077839 [Biomphalaria glabrata]|uniref:Uncharacterized protein LOC106077839 n=1 Tax=Biomphalaria glabrata TaxID=6526 RepID=A0A9W2YQ69_BIOGL|nr:uncharacterized protein LOC106077839 [Biomphalaria glabrata]